MGSTELSGVQAFTFYDPSTGTTVQVGGDYVADFRFEQERGGTNAPENPSGGRPAGGDFSEVEIEFLDQDAKSQLETWRANDTAVSLVVAGQQACIQWYETDILSDVQKLPTYGEHGNLDRLRVLMTREGHGIHDIYAGTNLLRPLNHQVGSTFLNDSWQDSDSSGVADGYTTTGTTNDAFSSNEQSFDTSSSGANSYIAANDGGGAALRFPVEGVDLTLSANLTQLHSSEDDLIKIISYDSAMTILSNDSSTVTSTGRSSVTATSPSNVFSIAVRPHEVFTSSTSETVKSKLPALRLDGSDQYAEY